MSFGTDDEADIAEAMRYTKPPQSQPAGGRVPQWEGTIEEFLMELESMVGPSGNAILEALQAAQIIRMLVQQRDSAINSQGTQYVPQLEQGVGTRFGSVWVVAPALEKIEVFATELEALRFWAKNPERDNLEMIECHP